jgi:Zn-dependent peptidase ImmA (M78 family)
MSTRANAKARELIEKYCINDPSDLNVRDIANAENLMIKEEDTKGHVGRIYKDEEGGIITIDSKIKEAGRKNFTVAHEVGHYMLEKERERYCSNEDLMTYEDKKYYEREANIFAAELLMPVEWVREYVKWKDDAIETFEEAARMFGTTLSSMSLRYAECGKYPIAVIFTQDGRVKWSCINIYFPFKYVEHNQKVNSFSKAYEFYQKKEIDREPNDILADAWFLKDFNYERERYMIEQNLPMKKLNAVLTFLWEL